MSLLFRVALVGFSAPERTALAGCFRMVNHRVPRYEQVQETDDADLVVADADDALSERLVLDGGRLPDAVFVGRRAPAGAAAWLPRPLDPSQVLRSLDILAAARALGRHGTVRAAAAWPLPEPLAADKGAAGSPSLRRSTIEAALERIAAEAAADASAVTADEIDDEITGGTAQATTSAAAPRALLVDSSEVALRFLQTRLARLGVASRLARDSDEALSLLEQFEPDLVFVDIELAPSSPLDGLTLARLVRTERATRVPPLPVFALAARIGEADRVRAALAGCETLLLKPPADPDLAALLARHGIGRGRPAPGS